MPIFGVDEISDFFTLADLFVLSIFAVSASLTGLLAKRLPLASTFSLDAVATISHDGSW